MMQFETYFKHLQTAPVDNGLHYWEQGCGTPTLLFLHGALGNGFTFRKVITELSNHFHCLVLHLPLGGHHIPLSPSADLSPQGIAALICSFLQFKGLSQVHIVANDTGGAYAQVFTAIYPDMVSSLILSNCEVKDIFPPPKFAYLKHAVRVPGFTFLMARLFSITSLLTHPAVMGSLSCTLTNEVLASGYIHSFVKHAAIRNDFARACRHWHPKHTIAAATLLQGFSKPVLVLWGNKDHYLFPLQQMQKLLDIFPQAQWETIYNAKTYIQEDAPEQTITAIRHFIHNLSSENNYQ